MDNYDYNFDSEKIAHKTEREIVTAFGKIVRRSGKSLAIEAPTDQASVAAMIAEQNGGKMKYAFLFDLPQISNARTTL